MIGLVLAGGGVRGSYQIGAYFAFKKCNIKFDGFVGTSIGSFNAAMLASGKEEELLEFWQNANIGKILGFNEKYIEEINNRHKSNNILYHLFRNGKEVIHNRGLSIVGLQILLQELNLEEDLRNSSKDFGLVTVKARNFKPIYMYKEDIPRNLLDDYIIASCYLPVFKMQKIIDGSYYLDGGFYDNAPVNMLLKKGYDLVYVVDLSSVGISRKPIDKNKVITIKPSHNLKSILNTNLDDIKYNIKLGYYDTIKVLKNLDGTKYIFKNISNWYYRHLMRNVSESTKQKMAKLFHTTIEKDLIIKSIEHLMSAEKYEYTYIYNPIKVIRELKHLRKKGDIYKFINELRIF